MWNFVHLFVINSLIWFSNEIFFTVGVRGHQLSSMLLDPFGGGKKNNSSMTQPVSVEEEEAGAQRGFNADTSRKKL